jgi:hypothetical protein
MSQRFLPDSLQEGNPLGQHFGEGGPTSLVIFEVVGAVEVSV